MGICFAVWLGVTGESDGPVPFAVLSFGAVVTSAA